MMRPPYTEAEAAEMMGCTPERIAEMLVAGELPGVKLGRSWRIPAGALHSRLDEMALEEASRRRSDRQSARATRHSDAPKRKGRREPPQLPAGRG